MLPLSLTSSTAARLRRETLRQASIQLTIEVGHMSELLRLLSENFGGLIWPTRMQAIDHARKMKLTLSMNASSAQQLIGLIVRSLPCAEIGRISHHEISTHNETY